MIIHFHTGVFGNFADNASKLGIILKEVDMAVMSHGHFDYAGGLRRFP